MARPPQPVHWCGVDLTHITGELIVHRNNMESCDSTDTHTTHHHGVQARLSYATSATNAGNRRPA